MKKTLIYLVLVLILVLLVPGVCSYAADAKVTLKPSTKKTTYGNVTVSVSSSISSGSIYKIEWKKGKITKSASKYWKDSKDITKTSKFSVKKNGWYSVRIIDKNEKIYVKSIKIKNIKKAQYHGYMTGYIKGISEKDKNGEYTITVDFVDQIKCAKSDLWNKSIGDSVKVAGHKGVIVDVLSDPRFPDGYAELTKRHTQVNDERYYVVVRFDDFDNYVLANDYNPKGIEFGFVLDGAETYRAYYGISYNSFIEVYTPEEYYVEKGVKLKVTKETSVQPAIFRRADGSFDYDYRMNGIEYIENIKGIKNTIGDGCITKYGSIREMYDEKNKCYTNYVDEIIEKYMP